MQDEAEDREGDDGGEDQGDDGWVLLHLIKATSRHAGHADIIRETLDGRTAGPLTEDYDAQG